MSAKAHLGCSERKSTFLGVDRACVRGPEKEKVCEAETSSYPLRGGHPIRRMGSGG